MSNEKTENIMEVDRQLAEVPKIIGIIRISHDITCPHCNESQYDDLDRDWWSENITDQMPSEESYRSEYEVICPECGKKFIVDGFTC
jgi:DNA-directed RNA polymerase subunit RPC12/RpoP